MGHMAHRIPLLNWGVGSKYNFWISLAAPRDLVVSLGEELQWEGVVDNWMVVAETLKVHALTYNPTVRGSYYFKMF